MSRRYFVTAKTEHEPPDVMGQRIDADNFDGAWREAHALAERRFLGRAYRLTSITEEVLPGTTVPLSLSVYLGRTDP